MRPTLAIISLGLLLALTRTSSLAAAAVGIYDTNTPAATILSGSAVAGQAGWTLVVEETTDHQFRGDTVLANERLTLVFRRGGPGAELYARGPSGVVCRAVLAPAGTKAGTRCTAVAIVENTASQATVDATFQPPDAAAATFRFELQPGQVFVRTEARQAGQRLRIEAPCRFAVLPDFFADDIAVNAAELPVDRAELPSENFLLQLAGHGESIVLAIWNQREEEIQVTLSGQGPERRIQASEIPFGKQGKVYVAVLESTGIWHVHNLQKTDADKVLRLEWQAPFPAQWRADFRQDDGLTDSWEMLHQRPDGKYGRADWFGQSDAYGTPDWMQADRKRWTTVLGSFHYPCWIDNDGQGFLQPLKKPGKFQGPTLIYPVNRVTATPLSQFTFVDLVRATLGVGPCEYVLDVEGQKKQAEGIPTCATRTKLNAIYALKQQKIKRAEVEQSLVDVLAFVRHIRGRIDRYGKFGHDVLAYLEQQKNAHPELAGFVTELETLTRRIDEAVAKRIGPIGTPEYATGLADEFRRTVLDNDGDEALEKCYRITAAFVQIGGNQDELVGECRGAVKILRQRAGLSMATDLRTSDIAQEIRRRTQTMLRNPVSYEAPRH